MCQIEVERRDGDESVLYRLEVGVLARFPGWGVAADPVVLPAAWVEAFDNTLAVNALAQARDLHAAKADGEVDVENDLGAATPVQNDTRQFGSERRAFSEREVLADECRKRDRWDVE